MYTTLLVAISLFLSIASATTCADQAVFESCLGTTQGAVTAYCTDSTDYACLCTRWTAVVNCYNSCPNETGAASANSTMQTYCADASVYGTKTSSAFSAPATTSSVATTTAGVDGAVRTASSTASSTAAAKSNAALRESAGGVGIAAFVGVAAVFL